MGRVKERMYELKLSETQLRAMGKTLMFARVYPDGFSKREQKFAQEAGLQMMKMLDGEK